MNGERSSNKKFKTLLMLFFCLITSDFTNNSKHSLYLKDFIYNKQDSTPTKFSSTDKIVLFREKAIVANYYKSVDRIESSIMKVLDDPYLLDRRKKLSLLNFNQKSRIQVKSLEKYFLKDITLNAFHAQELKANMVNIKNYRSQVDSESSIINKVITQLFKTPYSNEKKLSIQFYETKGKLLLPTSGSIMKATGEPFTSGTVPWNGILISSKPNESVRAVGKGKVIFADNFIGFQTVIIVDHGNGYFTIYGNLNAIDVNLGQQISTGEVVGRVGKKNSSNIDGLYFEIRKAGTSLNSEQWFAN